MAEFSSAYSNAFDVGDRNVQFTTTIDNLLYPIITFKVNMLPINISINVDLIGYRDRLEHRNKQVSIMIPGVQVVLHNEDTFVLKGIDAVQVKKLYSTGRLGDYFSQPLMIIEEVR